MGVQFTLQEIVQSLDDDIALRLYRLVDEGLLRTTEAIHDWIDRIIEAQEPAPPLEEIIAAVPHLQPLFPTSFWDE